MKKISGFSLVFCKKIKRRSKSYSHTHVIFDEYKLYSFKKKTRAKRATNSPADLNFHVNDNMSLAALSLKDLLFSTRSKQSVTKYLADGLLASFSTPLNVTCSWYSLRCAT